MPGSPVKISSAHLAANSRPRPDDPACSRTGRPCGRPGHRQGAAHVEPLPLVVELVHLVGVGEQRRLAVEHQRVVVPAVPEAGRRLEELVGAVVARVVGQVLLEAEVLCLAVVHRRHHVPRGAAAREVVERGERPGDVERRVIGRRVGGPEPDVPGGRRHDPEHDAQVQLHRAGTGADRLGDRPAVDAGHGQAVVEEHQVEAPVLERPPQLLVVARGEEPVLGGGVAPRAGVDRGVPGLHEPHQRHLPSPAVGHSLPLSGKHPT